MVVEVYNAKGHKECTRPLAVDKETHFAVEALRYSKRHFYYEWYPKPQYSFKKV